MREETEVSIVRSKGITYFEVDDWLMAIVIPSRRREGRVTAHPMLRVSNVLVHASEKESYKTALAPHEHGSLLTHTEHGMGRIMNQLISQGFQDERCRCVLRIDDDWRGLLWTMTRGRWPKYQRFEDLLGIVSQMARNAIEGGIGVFAINMSPKPQARSALLPFQLRTWATGNFMGVCNRDLRSHDVVTMEDVDMSLQSLATTGMIWMDMRWHSINESQGMGRDKGGIADIRTFAQNDTDLQKMSEFWPGIVEPRWGVRMPSGMTRQSIHIPR